MTERAGKIVACVPAYNEEKTIGKVLASASRYVDEVVVVDDGSEDDTGIIAEKLGALVIRHNQNLGKGAALRDCFDWARNNHVNILVTLDGDGQHDPHAIPTLVEAILNGEADVVIGSRRVSMDMPAFRWFAARLLDRLTNVKADGVIVDSQSGYRAYSRRALQKVTVTERGMGVDSQILMSARDAGLRIVEIPVSVWYKGLDTSTYNPIHHTLDVFFSAIKYVCIKHPIRFCVGFAAMVFIVALCLGVQTLDNARLGLVVTDPAVISDLVAIPAFLSFLAGTMLFILTTVFQSSRPRVIAQDYA